MMIFDSYFYLFIIVYLENFMAYYNFGINNFYAERKRLKIRYDYIKYLLRQVFPIFY